jgi:hypothetical protein
MATTPQQAAQDWVNGISAKTAKITASVQAVTMSPGVAAARQKAVWQANTQAAADKWARRVGNLQLGDWQTKMINVGIPRMAQGAAANQDKMVAAMTALLPYIDQGKSRLPARGTYEQNKQRANAWMDHMHAFPGVGSR